MRLSSKPTFDIPHISEERQGRIRYLHLGSEWIQGAMLVQDPFHLYLTYTRELFAGLLLQETMLPKHLVCLGLGAGSVAKWAWAVSSHTKVTAVEINPKIVALAHSQFQVPKDDKRLLIIEENAEVYTAQHPNSTDYLIVDIYDGQAKGPCCSHLAFYVDCRNMLRKGGVLAINLFGRHRLYQSTLKLLQEAFRDRVLVLPPSENNNIIALALAGEAHPWEAQQLDTRVIQLQQHENSLCSILEWQKWQQHLREQNPRWGQDKEWVF